MISISGTTMTVTAPVAGYPSAIIPGHSVYGPILGTYIVAQLTGPAGGLGTYQISPSQTFTGTVYSGLQNEVKNHYEMKVGHRFKYSNLTATNCWAGSVGGQKGRAFVITARDQQASPVQRLFNAYIAGNTMTVTSGAAGVFFGECIAGPGVLTSTVVNGGSGSVFQVSPAQTVGSAASPVAMVASTTPLQTCPWNLIEDVEIVNCWAKNVSAFAYVFTADYSATARTRRVWIHNNLGFINPPLTRPGTADQCEAIWSIGPCADVTLDHNGFIMNPASPGMTNATFLAADFHLQNTWNGRAPFPSAAQQGDRWMFTNNLFDGVYGIGSTISAGGGNNFADGAAGLNAAFSNVTFTNNLFVTNAHVYAPGTNFTAGTYANVGMTNFVNNATAFVNPSDWNITVGVNATRSTSGGPIGSIF
jgi:hypothetical protein